MAELVPELAEGLPKGCRRGAKAMPLNLTTLNPKSEIQGLCDKHFFNFASLSSFKL